ncbi:MAG TPA: ATP-binding protein [Conexibacter sp.]|jgi:ATP-dependent DNA helicase RecG|nr:ATP-binding protein [Conexibacter sp.]
MAVGRETPLTLQERVRATLALGESHFREFKSALDGLPSDKRQRDARGIRKDIGEALVAFANADGGEMLVGVEDDGRITGVPHGEDAVETMLEAWKTHVHTDTPLPPPRVACVELDGKLVLYFSVEKGTAVIHLTSDGRCMQRRDRESVPVPTEQIRFERQERLSREYDRAFVDGGDPGVLDLQTVERIGEQIAPGLSPEKVLQLLDLAEYSGPGVRLRRAAVLLLAKDVGHWHPRCEVRILRVAGTELRTGRAYNVVHDTHVVGCILDLLTRAWEEIRPYLVETRLGPDGRFEEQVRYPEDACREALTNAIAHRDYSIEGRAIEVYVFDDRLEVRSPGALLSTVTVEAIKSLRGVHQSRNTIIARSLRELGYMREMGEGFRRIFHLMRAHDLVEPELSADGQSFVVSLRHRSVFSEEDQRWIEGYEHFELERDEEKVLLLGRTGAPLSVQQIMDAVDLVDTEDYRALIERLQQKGLIQSFRRGRVRTRSSPRWKVVQPKDAIRFYGELLHGAQESYTGQHLERRDFIRIAEFITAESPYSLERGLGSTFRRLGLVDAGGFPTGRLKSVLESPTQSKAPNPGPAKIGLDEAHDANGHASAALDPVESVVEAEEIREAGEVAAGRQPTKLFVGNLAYEAEREDLRNLFSSIGTVVDISLPLDVGRRGRNRGYGFVEMASTQEAKEAKKGLEGAELTGRRLRIDWAKS